MPLQDFSSTPLIDQEQFEMIVATCDDDAPGMLGELLGLFTGEAEPKFEELRSCAASLDRYKCSRIAHALAGASGNLGCLRLSRICRDYEHTSNANPGLTPAELASGAENIVAAYKVSVEAMQAEIAKLGK
jgi:HPt (histidine-containing phosphotransfer) domain-containing protein